MKSEPAKIAGATLLKEYGAFFARHHEELSSLVDKDLTLDENKTFLPIQVVLDQNESISIIDLVSSDNTLMTKVLGVLSSLCIEVTNLKKEAFSRHIPFLSIYEEYKESTIASQMESICRLSAFVTRCDDTLKNFLNQLFSLYANDYINLNGVELHYIINHIGELFTIIILIDVLMSYTSIAKNWKNYQESLITLNHKDSSERLDSILGAVENLTAKIMSDCTVENSIHNLLPLRSYLTEGNCSSLQTEFAQYVKLLVLNLDKLVQEKPHTLNMYKCIKANGLFVLNSFLFGVTDKKVFRLLIDLNAKAHSIPVAGSVLWFPEQFLLRYLSPICTSHGKVEQTILKARQNFITSKKASIVREETHLLNLVTQWHLKVEQYFDNKNFQLNASDMNTHANILVSGLDIAAHADYNLVTLVNLHVSLGVPLSKSMLTSIFHMLEMLKTIKNAIIRNHNAIVKSINMIIQHYAYQAASSIINIKQNLMSDKNFANQRLDELTCVVIAERAMRGAATKERNTVATLALCILPLGTCPDDTRANLSLLFDNIQTLADYMAIMDRLCDCSWLYWHQNVIPIYLSKQFLTQTTDAFRLRNMYSVVEDCALMLQRADKLFELSKMDEFIDNVRNIVDELVMKSTCQQIETNLRLHIHSHLQLDEVNPFCSVLIKKSLLFIDNFRLVQTYMATVPYVEHYLSTMFYNLTTVVLSNWRTYGEMRQMASFKFDLKTVEDNLPTQTLEQGLDVLEIMRNIHVFVSKYLYNLNNQIFIEKSSNNKHLNSINIQHIANSIRTHGTGIMNTTVNFTYQFLKNKFYTFSQFMFDEHIKSRLIKDLKLLKENSTNSGTMYNYKHAEKFNKGIRNLGLSEDGQSYLDLFRDLITQIGNAMGYVRMIRSGGRHCCADAIVFLPTMQVEKTFKNLTEECSSNINMMEAADNLDVCIKGLTSNFTKGTEYFTLLVDAFAPVFRKEKNLHLKNFYVIVPPLTLNFVEHLILAKDKMTKKNKVGAAFTDDGFAMGIAYILKLLNQDSNFDSLHWFESVNKHISEERITVEEQKAKGPVQLRQALALTEKKLLTLEREFTLLYYSLSSARIFFR